jgi:ubiquinone/menaquinone biosynthesis C-methylase UbiE
MLDPDSVKKHERTTYDQVAELFDSVWARYTARFAADLIDLMSPQLAEQALDVAGGSGAAGLKVAERIGPAGKVVIADISPGMLSVASRNAAARGLSHVETREMDAERLEFPDGVFDLATCTFGLMLLPDPGRALRELRRVLRPGGRLGVAVWGRPARTPFFSIPLAAVIRRRAPVPLRWVLRLPVLGARLLDRLLVSQLPDGPAPGSLSVPGRLEALVTGAGFEIARREARAFPLEFDRFDGYWDALIRGTPAVEMSRRLEPRMLDEVRREVQARIADPKTGRILVFNEALLLVCRKPS